MERSWDKAGEELALAESFHKGMTLEELKAYVASLREKFFAEKHMWHGEHIMYESAYLKGMERAIELMEKGLRP